MLEPKVSMVHHAYGCFGEKQLLENMQLEEQSTRVMTREVDKMIEKLFGQMIGWEERVWSMQLQQPTKICDIAYFMETVRTSDRTSNPHLWT